MTDVVKFNFENNSVFKKILRNKCFRFRGMQTMCFTMTIEHDMDEHGLKNNVIWFMHGDGENTFNITCCD